MDYTTPNADNQFDSNQLNDEMVAPLVPIIPLYREIPQKLKPINQWLGWTYHPSGDGKYERQAKSTPDSLEQTYKLCQEKGLGLGFALTTSDEFVAIRVIKADTQQQELADKIAMMAQTYCDIDPVIHDMYLIASAQLVHNVSRPHLDIICEDCFAPIFPPLYDANPDVQSRTKEFGDIKDQFCPPTWMERLRDTEPYEGQSEVSILEEILEECLGTPNWREDAHKTELWDFLAICWQYLTLRNMVYPHIKFLRGDERNDFMAAIHEAIQCRGIKIKKEKLTDTDSQPNPHIDPNEEWMNLLHCEARTQKVKEDRYNIGITLENHKEWQDRFSFDSFQHRIIIDAHNPLADPDVSKIIRWFGATTPFQFSGNRELLFTQAIYDTAILKTFDPLYNFVSSLKWDGKPRLRSWMVDMCGAPQTTHSAWIGYMTIMQMIARALNPGCMARQVPIWEGPENKGKTRMINILGKPWATTFDMSLDSKEAHMFVQGVWLAEIAELSALKATRTENRIKSFISQVEDSFIPKYSNNRVAYKRRAVFIGTTNDDDYLPSLTGNTRWYPIRTEWFDHEQMEQERDQLFAEAVASFRADPNTKWWEEPTVLKETIQDTRENRRPLNVYEDELRNWLDGKIPADPIVRDQTSWSDIAEYFLKIDKEKWKDKSLQMQIAAALKAIGWIKAQLPGKKGGGNVWRRP